MDTHDNSDAQVIQRLPKTLSSLVTALEAATPAFVVLGCTTNEDEGGPKSTHVMSVMVEMECRKFDDTIANATGIQKSSTTERLVIEYIVKARSGSEPATTKDDLYLPYEMPSALCDAIKKLYEVETECKLVFDSNTPNSNSKHEFLSIVFLGDHGPSEGTIEGITLNFNRNSQLS